MVEKNTRALGRMITSQNVLVSFMSDSKVDTANVGTMTLLFANNNNNTKKSVPLFWLSCWDGGRFGLNSGQGSTVDSSHGKQFIPNAA